MQTLHHFRKKRKGKMQQTVLPTKDLRFWQDRPPYSLLTFSPLNDRKGIESTNYCPIYISFLFFLKKKLLVEVFPLKILNSSFIVFIKAPFSSQFCFHSSVVKHNKNCQQSQADRQDLQSTSLLLPWELQSHPRAEPCFH